MLAREIDRAGIPVSLITALPALAQMTQGGRIVQAVGVPYPMGDPALPPDKDRELRKEIVTTALKALLTEASGPTLFNPKIKTAPSST